MDKDERDDLIGNLGSRLVELESRAEYKPNDVVDVLVAIHACLAALFDAVEALGADVTDEMEHLLNRVVELTQFL